MTVKPMSVWIGFDPRETAAFMVARESIRQFVIILLVGLTSGTYSSIFIAVPLLVSWSKGELPFIEADTAE